MYRCVVERFACPASSWMARAGAFEKAYQTWSETESREQAHWQKSCVQLEEQYKVAMDAHQTTLAAWEAEKKAHGTARQTHNRRLKSLEKNYSRSSSEIESYFRLCIRTLLARIPLKFPESKSRPSPTLHYDHETQSLVVDLRLPTPGAIPTLREVRFIKSRNEFKRYDMSKRERDAFYDDALYQLTIGIIGAVFKWDTRRVVEQVVVNGRVWFRDEATGKQVESCIISLQSSRAEFAGIQLGHVNARSCFRKLKGVGSGKLHGLVPVAPLLEFSRRDERFVTPRAVAGHLGEGENLAAMDWEDFEHLVREVFEQEFARSGGQVKITITEVL